MVLHRPVEPAAVIGNLIQPGTKLGLARKQRKMEKEGEEGPTLANPARVGHPRGFRGFWMGKCAISSLGSQQGRPSERFQSATRHPTSQACWIHSALPASRSQARHTTRKTSPMKSLGLLKPLPQFASVAAVGFAATISSSDLPCLYSYYKLRGLGQGNCQLRF
jgi:hypothetical protein